MPNLECSRSMSISGIGSKTNCPNKFRNSLKQQSLENQIKSLASGKVTDSKDVSITLPLSNDQILKFDTTMGSVGVGAWTNVDLSSADLKTAPKSKEFFVKNGGNDGNAGNTSTFAYGTLQKAVVEAGKIDAFNMVSIYVTGDVVWNPSNFANRLRETSFGGNLSRGLVIRGLADNIADIWPSHSDPREVKTQLKYIANVLPGTFTKDAPKGHGTTVTYSSSASQSADISYYRTADNKNWPIVFDDSANTDNKVILLSSEGAIPSDFAEVAANINGYGFPGKVTLNNGGDNKNLGFCMTGNIQFVEVEFVLQHGVVTPYSVNGELQILYSKFSKTGSSAYHGNASLTATLALSVLGNGSDHLSTLRISDPDNEIAGGKIIHVYKSHFEDLVIKFDSMADIRDCTFRNCVICNPHNATFKGCTFYHSIMSLGDPTDTNAFGSSAKVDTCQFLYGRQQADNVNMFTLLDSSMLYLKNVFLTPRGLDYSATAPKDKTVQHVSTISVGDGSNLHVHGIRFPVTDNGICAEDGVASLLTSVNSHTTLHGVITLTKSTGTNALLDITRGDVRIGHMDVTTIYTGELLIANESNINFGTFVLGNGVDGSAAGAKITVDNAGSGVFVFNACNVDISQVFTFCLDTTIATTEVIMRLVNSSLRNRTVATTGCFNLQNKETKRAIECYGSSVDLSLGDTADPQGDLHGNIYIIDSKFSITAGTAGLFDIVDQNASGDYAFSANNSRVSIRDIGISSDSGTGATGTATAISVDNSSNVLLSKCPINMQGSSKNGIIVDNGSSLIINTANITFLNATSKANIAVSGNSKLSYRHSGGSTSTLTAASDCDRTILVENNSSAVIEEIIINGNNNRALDVKNGSNATLIGDTTKIAAQETSNSDNLILVQNNSNVYMKSYVLEGKTGADAPTGIMCRQSSSVDLNKITITPSRINASKGAQLRTGSRLHSTDMATFTTNFQVGAATHAWSTLTNSPKIVPVGSVAITEAGWNQAEGCTAVYT